MASNKNHRDDGAANPHQSTPQERLQSLSLKHWKQPIETALDLHLHGRHTFRGGAGSRVLIANGYRNWDDDYCEYLARLVPMMDAALANEKLSARFAKKRWMGGAKAWMVLETIKWRVRDLETHEYTKVQLNESEAYRVLGIRDRSHLGPWPEISRETTMKRVRAPGGPDGAGTGSVGRGSGHGGVGRGGIGAGEVGRGNGHGGVGRGGVGAGMADRGHGLRDDIRAGVGRGAGVAGRGVGRNGGLGGHARGRGGHGRRGAHRGGDARGRGGHMGGRGNRGRGNSTYYDRDQPRF